jgi:hypothetical protein
MPEAVTGSGTDWGRIYRRMYYQKNTERIKQNQREYYRKNQEKIRQHQRDYYWENREECLARMKRYRQEHREELREYARDYHRARKAGKQGRKDDADAVQPAAGKLGEAG